MSVLMAVGTLIPASGKRLDSDGMVFFKMLSNGEYRDALVAKLMFVERLQLFRVRFAEGKMSDAAEQLARMKLACRTSREAKLQAIVDHLQEHLSSGESLEECKWSPDPAATEEIA